jgi:hypothetical protein
LLTYVPNVGVPSFIKQILLDLKTQISPNTIIIRDFSPVHRSLRQKSTEKPRELNDTVGKNGHLQSISSSNCLFSASHGTFFKTVHILEHKVLADITK